jgi:Flp pilus assembly protein TadD
MFKDKRIRAGWRRAIPIMFAALLPMALTACGSVGDRDHAQLVSAELGGPELRLARAARTARDYGSAVNLYKTSLNIHPDDPGILVELGETLLEIGMIEDAIDTFNHVDASSPARLGAELGLGRSHLATHQPDMALAHFENSARLAPQDAKALIGQGVCLDLLGRRDEAQAKYRAVLAARPTNIAARNNLALSLALDGQFSEAVEIMNSLASSPTATSTIRQNLALVYGLQGDMNRAASASKDDLSPAAIDTNLKLFAMLQSPQ